DRGRDVADEHDVVAVAAVVVDVERHAADPQAGPLRQPGEGAAHRVAAVVVDDDEALARVGAEAEGGVQGGVVEVDGAGDVKLVVALARVGAVQLHDVGRAGAEGQVLHLLDAGRRAAGADGGAGVQGNRPGGAAAAERGASIDGHGADDGAID